MSSLLIRVPDRPWTINIERNWHHHRRAKHAKTVRDASTELWHQAAAAKGIVRLVPRVAVTCWASYPTRRSLPDVGAIFPACKAAIDGLVDAGLLDDDDESWVSQILFHRAQIDASAGNGMFVVVTEIPPEPENLGLGLRAEDRVMYDAA